MSPQNFQSSKTKIAAVVVVELWFYSTEQFSFQEKVTWHESILILIPVCVERGERC